VGWSKFAQFKLTLLQLEPIVALNAVKPGQLIVRARMGYNHSHLVARSASETGLLQGQDSIPQPV